MSSGIGVSSLALETFELEGDDGSVREVEAGEGTAGRVVSESDESVRQQSIIFNSAAIMVYAEFLLSTKYT